MNFKSQPKEHFKYISITTKNMNVITDLHLHSRYARACSKDLSIKTMSEHAKIKGINILGTGDAQHPKWQEELKKELTNNGKGIFESKYEMQFALTTEISFAYSQGGKGRRIHLITWFPDFDILAQFTEFLLRKGRIDYDGRPIFGMNCAEYVDECMKISKDIEIIPAHCWTPYFGVYGSKSGFDSLKECFQEQLKNIHAIETGISSDPAMNWRLPELDDKAIVSFSDAHSYHSWRLGREVTIFDMKENSYKELIKAIRENKIIETIEFFPEEGKYHYDGHRNCNIVMEPNETIKNNNICPVCKKTLTIGVAHRIEELAKRPHGFKPKNARPYRNLIPLAEIISGAIGSPVASKKVAAVYNKLIEIFGNEFNILLNASDEEIQKTADEKIAEYIIKNRHGQIKFRPGYDGEYGHPIFEEKEEKKETVKPTKVQKGIDEY